MIRYEFIELKPMTDEEIYKAGKASTIRSYKIQVCMFNDDRYSADQKMWIAQRMDERAQSLICDYGMDWDEVDALEIATMRANEAYLNGVGPCPY